MADYATQFSCLLDVGSPANVARALVLAGSIAVEASDEGGSELWIHDGGNGDVEQVIRFALLCAEAFDLTGRWGFEYASTCSKPRLDAVGGGAHVLDLGTRETVGWVSTGDWLTTALAGGDRHA